mmetsp:Transcript_26715/g.35715  ORF Transcript_26715/g.35715 Transcript_26715/m.35715 type:complete len:679 (-) Transcript_26715:105-2141(-)
MTPPPSRQQWSIEVPQTSRSDRGNIHRSIDAEKTPSLGSKGCRTLYEAVRRGRDISPLGPCLGFRAVSTSGFATPFVYSSYVESVARMDNFAAGLERLSLVEKNDDGMLLLGIYMRNCMEWIIAEQGTYALGGITVPFYDTLGPETVQFMLTHTDMACVVCTRAELPRLCSAKKTGKCPKFRAVILVDGVTPDANSMAKEAGLDVVSFAKVEAVGAQLVATEGHKHNPPSGHDVATFCYTSGTTGNPKGALITHENVMSTIAGMPDGVDVEPFDRHISYLPLPHIFERVVINQMFLNGASVAFYRGKPEYLVEDIIACRPTMMIAAPRVLNKIHDKIMGGMEAAGGMKKRIFDAGLAAKREGLQHGKLTHGLYDALIFNKIKKALGMDCIRALVCGSAPLSDGVMTFFRCLLGVPIMEGYGQTEGTAAATIGDKDDFASIGHVGGPTAAVEIVLMDVPEMGYLHTDTSHQGQPCRGRGEICVRGPNVFKGYYKDEEKTRETIDEEGWLHSGDVGLWTLNGQLRIIDRKKNIFKLANGEYVAAEKIENVLVQSLFIGQCFVHGDSYQTALVGIIVPDEEVTRAWAVQKDASLANASFAELCGMEELKSKIMQDIKSLSKKCGLHGFETVRAFHLSPELFAPENGLVTPTFKLKRPQLREHFQKNIDEMYAKLPPPPSKL